MDRLLSRGQGGGTREQIQWRHSGDLQQVIEGWPQQLLIEPPFKAKEGPRWEDFPRQLQDDLEAHLRFLASHRRGHTGKHLRP